jgi:hypothetical protein
VDFFVGKFQKMHVFSVGHVPDRIGYWWGILDKVARQGAKGRWGAHAEARSRKADTDDGGCSFPAFSFLFGLGLYPVHMYISY